jgi:hypothetical protein
MAGYGVRHTSAGPAQQAFHKKSTLYLSWLSPTSILKKKISETYEAIQFSHPSMQRLPYLSHTAILPAATSPRCPMPSHRRAAPSCRCALVPSSPTLGAPPAAPSLTGCKPAVVPHGPLHASWARRLGLPTLPPTVQYCCCPALPPRLLHPGN